MNNAINGIIKGIFAATGQTCLAGSRVFVQKDITDEFVSRLTDRAHDIDLGDPRDPETEMGPVAFRDQWETNRDYIQTAHDEGATLQFGGQQPDNPPGKCFFQPTILTDVENNMTVAQEEIFGPVVSILTFSDEDTLIDRANDTDLASLPVSGLKTSAKPTALLKISTQGPFG